MAVTHEKKEAILTTLEGHLSEAKSVTFTSSQRITVEEITKMKKELRSQDVVFMLAKKTLIRIAFKKIYAVDLDIDTLPGQVAVAIAKSDAMSGMTIINKYVKEWKKDEKITLVGAYIEGRLMDANETQKLASLPSREVLLGRLLGSLLSPLSGLARFFDGARKELESRGGKTLKDLIVAGNAKDEPKHTAAPDTPKSDEKTEESPEPAPAPPTLGEAAEASSPEDTAPPAPADEATPQTETSKE